MKEQLLVKMIFGSHLYSLNTENSDKDFKGIFLPTSDQILLGRIPKQIDQSTNKDNVKNTKYDVDCQLIGLHEFVRLACKGETVAIDMLHAEPEHIVERGLHEYDFIWRQLLENRTKFYSSNMTAFMGYVRKQAHKYGVKGSRLAAAQEVHDIIKSFLYLDGHDLLRVENLRQHLPINAHAYWSAERHPNGEQFYEVCGRKLSSKLKLDQALLVVASIVHSYGDRAELAKNNQNIDWKAISHALRAGYQLAAIFEKGDFRYPLEETQYLRDVKAGRLDFQHNVQIELDELVLRIEMAAARSNYPKTVDNTFWDKWLTKVMKYVLVSDF